MRRSALVALLSVLAACVPEVTRLDVAAADGSQPLRSAAGLKVTADIDPSSTSRSPRLTLRRVSPAGPGVDRAITRSATNGAIETWESVLPAGDASVPLPQGSRWTARVDVPYVYGWTEETVTREIPFQVLEPASCGGFIDAPTSPAWTLKGYFKNDGGAVVRQIRPQLLPSINWPDASEGDRSFGFEIDTLNVRSWAYNDMWSAEFISPPLSGGTAYAPWAEMKRYSFWARTNAAGMRLQAIITILDTAGNPRVFRLVTANGQAVFWPLAADDAWHQFTVDFGAQSLPAGHVLSLSLRAFGTRSDAGDNIGKFVAIDQVCRLP